MNRMQARLTAKEWMDYLSGFPEDSEVGFVVLDAHQEGAVAFTDKELILLTGEDQPVVFINIDRRRTVDIFSEKAEVKKAEAEEAAQEKTT